MMIRTIKNERTTFCWTDDRRLRGFLHNFGNRHFFVAFVCYSTNLYCDYPSLTRWHVHLYFCSSRPGRYNGLAVFDSWNRDSSGSRVKHRVEKFGRVRSGDRSERKLDPSFQLQYAQVSQECLQFAVNSTFCGSGVQLKLYFVDNL